MNNQEPELKRESKASARPKVSTKMALAFVLPAELSMKVQAVRSVKDKAFSRWPPHINFLFPFIHKEVVPGKVEELCTALASIEPFDTVLETIGYFVHNKNNITGWIAPTDNEPFKKIYNAAVSVFPELNEQHAEFTPHMTLGQ